MSVSLLMAQRSCETLPANVFDCVRNTGLPAVISCNESCCSALDFLKCSNVTLLVRLPGCSAVLQLWSYRGLVRCFLSFRCDKWLRDLLVHVSVIFFICIVFMHIFKHEGIKDVNEKKIYHRYVAVSAHVQLNCWMKRLRTNVIQHGPRAALSAGLGLVRSVSTNTYFWLFLYAIIEGKCPF